jgi:hypothetical protein
LELLSKIRGASCKYVDRGLISNKYKGFFVKWQELSGCGIIFQWEKVVDSVHGSVDCVGVADGRGSPELGLAAASGCSGLPLTRARTTARRRRTGGVALAPSCYGVGANEEGRWRGEGVGCSTGV